MKLEKILGWLAVSVVCSLLLATGCEPAAKEAAPIKVKPEKPVPKAVYDGPVTLALKFKRGDLSSYRVVIEMEKSVQFEEPVPDRSGSKLEMTYFQRIKNVNDKGNAIAQITIKELKYTSIVTNAPLVRFDSTLEKDMHNPMAKLIGESYTIEITPTGQVAEVTDFLKAQLAIRSSSRPGKAASALVGKEAIKQRHELIALPAAGKNQLNTNDNWSNLKSFSFGMMGSKSFERIYTLKEIKDVDGRQVAIVEMNAIPSAELLKQQHKAEKDAFSEMADSTETYTGRLKLNLTTGKIEEFTEKLESQWVIINPEAQRRREEEPDALIMKATHFYNLEKIR
ncbi:MAG: DUF6263 family protein [Planctomycetota bacterium]|jgi:hypothetical protein